MVRRRWWLLGGGALALVVLAVAALWFFVLRGDAPPEVDLVAANAQLDDDLAADASTSTTTTEAATSDDDGAEETTTTTSTTTTSTTTLPPFDGDPDGTWVIDDEIGSFDFETASGSFAGFRVDEELAEFAIEEVTAVGRSGGVSGHLVILDGALVEVEVTVDMTVIVSDDSRREDAIRRAVQAADFPAATFTLSESILLPDGLADGVQISVEAAGDLTIAGLTNPATFTIDALIRGDGFGVVVGTTEVVFDDYDITPPSAPIVLSVEDHGIVEFQLIVRKSPA